MSRIATDYLKLSYIYKPRVPGPKCPWDILGYPGMSYPVPPKTLPRVPGPKCPWISWDIPGCPILSHLRHCPESQVPNVPGISWDIPGCPILSHLRLSPESQVPNVPGISWDIPWMSYPVPGEEVVQGPRSQMSWEILGYPGDVLSRRGKGSGGDSGEGTGRGEWHGMSILSHLRLCPESQVPNVPGISWDIPGYPILSHLRHCPESQVPNVPGISQAEQYIKYCRLGSIV